MTLLAVLSSSVDILRHHSVELIKRREKIILAHKIKYTPSVNNIMDPRRDLCHDINIKYVRKEFPLLPPL